jgi:hypothetical protein
MKKMGFLWYVYQTNRRKMLSGDITDTGPWPAGPAASSAQSGGEPTGWVFSLPHSFGLFPIPLVSLWFGWYGKKRKTK